MKKSYYIQAQKLLYTRDGVSHYGVYLQWFEGFQTALYKFHDLDFLRKCYGGYKNIVLYRYDGKNNRVILRQA